MTREEKVKQKAVELAEKMQSNDNAIASVVRNSNGTPIRVNLSTPKQMADVLERFVSIGYDMACEPYDPLAEMHRLESECKFRTLNDVIRDAVKKHCADDSIANNIISDIEREIGESQRAMHEQRMKIKELSR